MRDNWVYLRQLLDSISRIEEYVAGKSFEDFTRDRLVQDGVILQIALMGEAARKLSTDFQQSFPEIPWADMIGMRNILIHDYLGVDISEVWKAVQSDVPELKQRITQILTGASDEQN